MNARLTPRALVIVAGLEAVAPQALADTITVIYSKKTGHPSAIIPGALDLNGNPVVTEWRALEDLVVSPDGSMWVIKGRTQLGSDLETNLVLGSGNSGTTYAQEGQPIPDGAPGELWDFFGSGLGRFNTANDFAFSGRAKGGSSSTFQKVLVRDSATGITTIEFQMGDPITGLIDQPPNPSGDELFGNSVGSIHILDDGTIGSQDSTIQLIHSSRRPAIMYDAQAFHQSNVTQILDIDGVTPATWDTIDANTFYTSPDGAHWIATGDIGTNAANDDVFVYDEQVRIRESFQIGTSGVTAVGIFASGILTDGTWFARGDDPSDNDWAVIDGEVVAKTGDEVVPGSGLTWGAVFSAFSVNTNGDWVIAGTIVDPDGSTATDEALVLNGERIILREGDPIDLDNNGVFDDDAYIGRGTNTLTAFDANDLNIDPDGDILVFVSLRDDPASGLDLGSNPAFGTPTAFLRIVTADACIADLSGSSDPNDPAYGVPDGAIDSSDFFYYLDQFVANNLAVADLSGSSDPNDPAYGVPDGAIDSSDFFYYLDQFVLGCP